MSWLVKKFSALKFCSKWACSLILSERGIKNESKETYSTARKRRKSEINNPMETAWYDTSNTSKILGCNHGLEQVLAWRTTLFHFISCNNLRWCLKMSKLQSDLARTRVCVPQFSAQDWPKKLESLVHKTLFASLKWNIDPKWSLKSENLSIGRLS